MTSEIELFEVVCPADYQPSELEQAHHESMQDRIVRVTRDYADLQSYYDIGISPTRSSKLSTFFRDEYKDLLSQAFELYSEEEKIDYILLKNYLRRNLSELQLIDESNKKMDVVLPFAPTLVRLCENKRDMKSLDPQEAAKDVYELGIVLESVERDILGGKIKVQKATAYRAANMLANLQKKIQGWFLFYDGYDPSFTWWLGEPFKTMNSMMDSVIVSIRQTLVGISPDDNDAIVGQPIGREGLLAALDAEMIAYTPEQIIKIGHSEYAWCESEMKKAAQELGFENDWRAALEHVKNTYVEPGKQPQLIFDLAHEAIEFVAKYDLVTVPLIASQQWRMFMMSPEEQKTNPFFLGGNDIQVSYPTNTMGHKDKLMSMRGNNPHFARSTVFHEVIPGHKLQYYSLMRYKPYRAAIGNTPFWIEGWAFYCTCLSTPASTSELIKIRGNGPLERSKFRKDSRRPHRYALLAHASMRTYHLLPLLSSRQDVSTGKYRLPRE